MSGHPEIARPHGATPGEGLGPLQQRFWIALALVAAAATWALFVTDRAPQTSAAWRGFPLDDAWIHLVYARSLVTEGGFHYNVGEPEAGMTSPLWVTLEAGVVGIAGPSNTPRIVPGVKLLSLASGLAAIVLLFLLGRELGRSALAGLCAAWLMALDPAMSFARASGMEVTVFIALVLGALWAALRGRVVVSGLLLGLSIVARPEGMVLLPVLAVPFIARPPRPSIVRTSAAIALAVLPAAAYSAWCMRVTGHPLPNTFYVKFAGHNPLDLGNLAFVWKHYVYDDLPWFPFGLGAILVVLGIVRGWRQDRVTSVTVLGAGMLLFASAAMSRTFRHWHFFYWERWIMPAMPFVLLLIGLGIEEIRSGLQSFRGSPRRATRARRGPAVAPSSPPRGWMLTAIGAGIVLLVQVPVALPDRADQYAWNAQNIEELNVTLGRWVAQNLPPDAVVAVNDAGALRYFGGRKTIDLLGLNTHRMLPMERARGGDPSLHIGWFVIFPSWFPQLARDTSLVAIHGVKAPHYTIVDAPQDSIVVYRLRRPGEPRR